MRNIEIAIDFDGTCTTHEYPFIGKDIGAQKVLKELIRAGHKLILYTMRSGPQLDEAVSWFYDNNITLYGIQYNPTQGNWTKSNKCYAQLYIDDAALGCPLIYNPLSKGGKPYVDWKEVEKLLTQKGIL